MPRALALLLLLFALPSCAWLPFAPRAIGNCPGPLVSTDDLDGRFLLQHRLRVIAEGIDFPFQSVLQNDGKELVFIGVNALGAKLFTVRQQGLRTEVEALPAAALPVPPLNLLRDMHRLLFLEDAPEGGADPRIESSQQGDAVTIRIEHARCAYTLELEAIAERPLPDPHTEGTPHD